jgi:UDP-N-acetylmuramoyl-L-alanyl-D-glutamate--2,6-diaminopimelate ligase
MDYKYRSIKNAFHRVEGTATNLYYGRPSRKLKFIGVTGTSGKTTTVTVLHQLFRQLGYKVGLISSIVNKVNDKEYPTELTTDRASVINQLLNKMVKAKCEYCFGEVTSQAIDQERHRSFNFAGAVYTNLSQDHLDYHHTMDEYASVKKRYFDGLPQLAFALVNIDDKYGKYMLKNTKAKKATFGLSDKADYKIVLRENTSAGIKISIEGRDFDTKFIGKHNAYNLIAVYATAILLGMDKSKVLNAFSNLKPVRGRTEVVQSKTGIVGLVDYAHKPGALKKVLESLNETKKPGQKIITVFGCGGDRDRGKRPQMAKIGYDLSGQLIITSDNPRTENPDAIIKEIQAGILNEPHYNQVVSITNRRKAIQKAVKIANAADIILIAGKGHENYQIVGHTKSHFDDVEELKKAYERYGK